MFSSPAKGTPGRRRAGTPSARSGTPLGRVSTPTHGRTPIGRFREDSVLSNQYDNYGKDTWSEKQKQKTKSDIQEGSVLSRDELHAVTVFCRMPNEVSSTIAKMGPYDPCLSHVDPQTGFAYVTVPDRCFVWSFASRGLESPPCFSFPVSSSPASTSSIIAPTLPFCSLIPRGADREPGLIILTQSGEVRFCDNVASSLGGDRMSSIFVPLGSGECISQLHRCSSSILLAGTTQSRLFSIRFIASGGSLQAQIIPFTQSRGLFGRLFGTAPNSASGSGVRGIASCQSSEDAGAYEVYAMGQSLLQKWQVLEGGGERLVVEEDFKQLLQHHLQIDNTPAAPKVDLVDIALTSTGTAAILFTLPGAADGMLRYQVAFAESLSSTPSINITATFTLEYSRYPDTRAYSQPRLVLPYGGPILYVVFSEAVVLRMMQGGTLEETLEMRNVSTDRIIGFGTEGPDVEASAGLSNLSIMTAISGALLIEVDVQRAQDIDYQLSSGADKMQILTQRLKSKIERAVFHSGESQNPISFDLSKEIGGNLSAAVEQLSEEIVQSLSPGLSKSVDLRVQLADRLDKLHRLALFLANNDRIGQLSHSDRRRLCSDGELLSAAVDVWDYYNTYLAQNVQEGEGTDPLGVAARAVIENPQGYVGDVDIVRVFFRSHLNQLDDLLARLAISAELENVHVARYTALVRTNHIFLSTFQAANRYRFETKSLFCLDPDHVAFEAWTYRQSNITALQQQFQATSNRLQDFRSQAGAEDPATSRIEDGVVSQQQVLRRQLCDLAVCALELYEERQGLLRITCGSNPAADREAHHLSEDFSKARWQMISSLIEVGRSDRAFQLGEKHKDFKVLTKLCCSLSSSSQALRIRNYLDKYGQAFAFELYEYYVLQGELTKLLREDEEYHGLLSNFLDTKEEYNKYAWLHDINVTRFAQASERLQQEADKEVGSVQSKKVMLSLRKLSYVSQLNESEIASAAEQERIESIDDQLDIVNVHQKIREEVEGKTAQRQAEDLEEMLDLTTEVLTETSPAFKELYCSLVRSVVNQAVLSCEDLIDLLTLHDTSDDSVEHFKTALEVLVRARDIPPSRQPEVLASIWRRAVLLDDWLEVTDTTLASTSDEMLVVKLKSTAYYQLLLNASENRATAEKILSPADWLHPSLPASMQARFRDSPQEVVEALQRDADAEVERARQVVEEGVARGWFDDVMRLVGQAQEEASHIHAMAEDAERLVDDENSHFMTLY